MAARTLFSLQLEHFSSLFILAGALQRVAPNLPLRQYRQVYSSMPPTSPTFEPTIGLSVYRKPVFFTGNYRKMKRGLSQTPW